MKIKIIVILIAALLLLQNGVSAQATVKGRNISAPIQDTTKAEICTHLMSFVFDFVKADSVMRRYIEQDGTTLFWIYNDYYNANQFLPALSAARRLGVKVILGISGNAVSKSGDMQASFYEMLRDTWDSAAIYRWHGKRSYEVYDYYNANFNINTVVFPTGITRNSLNLFITSHYPASNGQGGWVEEHYGYPESVASAAHLLDNYWFDGIIPFPVGIPNGQGPLLNLINGNEYIAKAAKAVGKFSSASINHKYNSAAYTCYFFDGTLLQLKRLLKLPLSQRPDCLTSITGDDFVEGSYMNAPVRTPHKGGMIFLIPLSSQSDIGPKTPWPIMDNSGIWQFCKPWIFAFRDKKTNPVIAKERLFCWYVANMKGAAFMPNPPQFLIDSMPPFLYGTVPLQTVWEKMAAHGPRVGHPEDNGEVQHIKVKAIREYQDPARYWNIMFAAHLKHAGFLEIEINNVKYTSQLQLGPDAYFEIPQQTGTPIFRILNPDGSVRMQGAGPMPITNNLWPSVEEPLIVEVQPE